MFIRNCWYVAAWDQEVPHDGLFHRTLLNEPVLLYRDTQGRVVALDARASQDELNTVRNFVNESYSGWTLGAIRRDLRVRLAERWLKPPKRPPCPKATDALPIRRGANIRPSCCCIRPI